MKHPANMDTRNTLACGRTVWERNMTEEDLAFVNAHPETFMQNGKGGWFNANLANRRDREFRQSLWTDTHPHAAT